MPYEEALKLAEIIDELHDKELLKTIAEGRKSIRKGARGVELKSSLSKRGISV